MHFLGIGTLGLPLNVDTLKSYASTPLDQEEEEKRANVNISFSKLAF